MSLRSPLLTLLVSGLCLSLFAIELVAQSDEQPPVVAESALTESETEPKTEKSAPAWEHLIFIPYKNFKQALNSKSQVVIPYLEYLKLKGLQQKQAPKVEAVLQESEYVVRIEGDVAKCKVTFQFHVWGEGQTAYPVQLGAAAIGEINSENEAVFLQAESEGRTSLIFPEPGEYAVELELMTKVQKGTDGKSFKLNVPASSVTLLDLTLNEELQKIELKPNGVEVATTAKEGQTRFRGNLKPTEQIEVRWHPEAGSKPEMNLLTSVQQKQEVTIEGEVVLTTALMHYEILRGQMTELQIAVPLTHQILDVDVAQANLKDWSVRKEDKRQIVSVEFLSPLEADVTVKLHTERPLEEGELNLLGKSETNETNSIHALDAVRERGEIIVKAASGLELTVTKQEGVSRFRHNDGKSNNESSQLAFRFYRTDAVLNVAVKQIKPRVLMQLAHRCVVQEESVESQVHVIAQIEREGLFELQFSVPAGLGVQYVKGAGVSEHRFDEEAKILHVFWSKKTIGTVQLQIGTTQYFEEPSPEQDYHLALIEALNVEKEEGTISMLSSSSLDIQVIEDDLFGVLPNLFTPTRHNGTHKVSHSWRYKERPIEVYFYVKPKPSHVTAEVATLLNIEEEMIRVNSEVNFRIQHAGVESFQVQVPAATNGKVRITPRTKNAQLFQQAVPQGEPVEGWQNWLITTQQPVVGAFGFNVNYDIKLQSDSPTTDAGLRKIQYQPLKVLSSTLLSEEDENVPVFATSVKGEVVVQVARHLSVQGDVTGPNAESIDVRELTLIRNQEASLAYQYFAEPVVLDIAIRKYDVQDVLQTVVTKAGVEIVLASDATASYLCNYRIRSSERQRLNFELPKNARPIRVLVDGKDTTLELNEAEAETGWESYFLNISRLAASDKEFFIAINYVWDIPDAPFNSPGGVLSLPLPKIGSGDQSSVVQQTRVGVWIPSAYSLLGTPRGYTQDRKFPFRFNLFNVSTKKTTRLTSWLGLPNTQVIDVPKTGNGFYYSSLEQVDQLEVTWWKSSFFTWVMSGTLALIALILMRTSWDNRITLALCGLLVLALLMLNYGDWVTFSLFSARYGLIFMVILWCYKTCKCFATVPTVSKTSVELKTDGSIQVVAAEKKDDPAESSPDKSSDEET